MSNAPERLGGATAGRGEEWLGEASTYYNMPLIKKAHWSWEVILYFFFGGMAGGSFLVSTLADLLGSLKDAALMRVGRYTALICILISPILLIKDLDRPMIRRQLITTMLWSGKELRPNSITGISDWRFQRTFWSLRAHFILALLVRENAISIKKPATTKAKVMARP